MPTADTLIALGMPPELANAVEATLDSDNVKKATADTVTAVKTMTGANIITHAPTGLKVQDSNASHLVTIAPGDESADRTLSIPVLGGNDTVMTLATAQTVAGAKTFSGNNTLTGSIQNTKTTVVTADTSPGPTLTFTGGLNLVSFTTNDDDTVSLPVNVAGDIGKEIEIYAVQGFELISADASATLNNVVIGATNECAFVAGTYAKLKLVADNTWLSVISTLIDGTQTKLVPDTLA